MEILIGMLLAAAIAVFSFAAGMHYSSMKINEEIEKLEKLLKELETEKDAIDRFRNIDSKLLSYRNAKLR